MLVTKPNSLDTENRERRYKKLENNRLLAMEYAEASSARKYIYNQIDRLIILKIVIGGNCYVNYHKTHPPIYTS